MHRRVIRGLVAALAVGVLLGPASAAFASKAPSAPYSPSLVVTWPVSAAGTSGSNSSTPYVVSGCGYTSGFGGVTVVVQSPVAVAFSGEMPDSNGCISLTNFATQGAGHYQISAYQTIRNRAVAVASTSFEVS